MPHFKLQELRAFNESALSLHRAHDHLELSVLVRMAMRQLVGADIFGFDWVDSMARAVFQYEYSPDDAISPELNTFAHSLLPTSSFWMAHLGRTSAISDFATLRQFSRETFFLPMHEIGQRDALSINLRLTGRVSVSLVALRAAWGRYTTKDRAQLNLLAPHVRQAYLRLQAAGRGWEPSRSRVLRHISVEADGRVAAWPPEVRQLLAEWGKRVRGSRLPEEIAAWHRAQLAAWHRPKEIVPAVAPLVLEAPAGRLRIHLRCLPDGASVLVFEPRRCSAEPTALPPTSVAARDLLTPREQEVMEWVCRGKTNAEIAGILSISPGTVRRHLENIFPRLGVENRHAAALSFLPPLRTES